MVGIHYEMHLLALHILAIDLGSKCWDSHTVYALRNSASYFLKIEAQSLRILPRMAHSSGNVNRKEFQNF